MIKLGLQILKMVPLLINTESDLMLMGTQQTAHIMMNTGIIIPLSRDIDQQSHEMTTMKIHFSLTLRINMRMTMSTTSTMKSIRNSSINTEVNLKRI